MNAIDGRVVYGVDYDSNGEPVYNLDQEGGVVGSGVMYDAQWKFSAEHSICANT